ncbi:hypothetical protein [Streptomyces sp. NPDC002602]|uniref:hypothetical protein n=1 Tax=Streptomyces sp. NPDC002602 TaxID=3364654 RepID=UPI003698FB38
MWAGGPQLQGPRAPGGGGNVHRAGAAFWKEFGNAPDGKYYKWANNAAHFVRLSDRVVYNWK